MMLKLAQKKLEEILSDTGPSDMLDRVGWINSIRGSMTEICEDVRFLSPNLSNLMQESAKKSNELDDRKSKTTPNSYVEDVKELIPQIIEEIETVLKGAEPISIRNFKTVMFNNVPEMMIQKGSLDNLAKSLNGELENVPINGSGFVRITISRDSVSNVPNHAVGFINEFGNLFDETTVEFA